MRKALGDVHAELVLSDVAEVKLEHVLEELKKVIASDDSGASVSISKLKEDYEAMIAKSDSAAEGAKAGAGGVALTRKTAAELGNIKADQALKAVREPMGPFNWCVRDTWGSAGGAVGAGSGRAGGL